MTFLHAQDGLFTWDRNMVDGYYSKRCWQGIEDVPQGNIVLRKLTLPAIEAGTLLELLWAMRISKAHLMPTLDNVAKEANRRAAIM